MDKDNQSVVYRCPNCNKSFKTKSGLYKHTKTIHPEPELTLIQKIGRPSKYDPAFCDQLVEWFSGTKYEKVVMEKATRFNKDGQKTHEVEKYRYVATDLPTLEGFARSICISYDTLLVWSKEVVDESVVNSPKKYPEFSLAYNMAKSLQKEFLIDNALKGHYPPASFIFTAKNITDMVDKQLLETKDHDYKEKQDALSDWFNTIRQHLVAKPDDPSPDPPAGPDIQE